MEYLKAESLKMKHTAVGKLSCLLPTASAVLAFLLTSSFFQVDKILAGEDNHGASSAWYLQSLRCAVWNCRGYPDGESRNTVCDSA